MTWKDKKDLEEALHEIATADVAFVAYIAAVVFAIVFGVIVSII